MDAVSTMLEQQQIDRLLVFTNREAGLRAFLVIDDLRLGPAAGGIRGICAIQRRDDEMRLIAQLEHTAHDVIETAQRDGLSVLDVAETAARRRLLGVAA